MTDYRDPDDADVSPARRTARLDKRADYRSYPQSMFTLLNTYRDRQRALGSAPLRLGPMLRVEAEQTRRQLYRFKMCLTHWSDEDPYARDLLEIFNSCALTIEHADSATATRSRNDQCFLVVRPSALDIAVSRLTLADEGPT